MQIRKLYLHNFRNYREAEVDFFDGVNLIQGDNAQGKTNLLEAFYLVSTGRSFRTPHLKELIHNEMPFFFVEAEFIKEGIVQRLKLSFDGQIKKLEYNSTSYSHFSTLLGLLPIVLLAPEDVLLITGAPAERRRFLDLQLAQSDPLYVYHITRYHKAVKHRNFLLRKKMEATLHSWETIMTTAAAYIHQKRAALVETLRKTLGVLGGILSSDKLDIDYRPSLTDNYEKHRAKEMIVGTTFIGPHRDDVAIFINGQEASSYASQGQLRSAIAALRLAQWHQLRDHHGVDPLFCIDDFGVHLDHHRRKALLESLSPFGQVVLTSPRFHDEISPHLLTIDQGCVKKAEPSS